MFRFLAKRTLTKECYLERLTGSDAGISVLNLHRPAVKNALGRNMVLELSQSIQDLRDTRVLILKSAVPGTFCVGADLKERTSMSQSEVDSFVFSLRSLFTQFEQLPMPTIAALDGFALGGGLELALAADLRVAHSNAKMGLVETRLAIIPGAGGTQRLSRLVGNAKAKELIYTACVLTGSEAVKIGLVNSVSENAYDSALNMARHILPNGPIALKMAKIAIDRGSQMDLSSGMVLEQACYAQVIPTQDRLEGLAAFKENRKAKFLGR